MKYLAKTLPLALLVFTVNCQTTQKSANEISVDPIELAPLARPHYEVLGRTDAFAERTRILFFEFGDKGVGTIKGRQDNAEYKSLKVLMCFATIFIVCHNYPLDARDAATYIAIRKMENADALVEPQYEREEINLYFYQKVKDTVSAKAIRYLNDDEIKNIKTTTKTRGDEDDEEE